MRLSILFTVFLSMSVVPYTSFAGVTANVITYSAHIGLIETKTVIANAHVYEQLANYVARIALNQSLTAAQKKTLLNPLLNRARQSIKRQSESMKMLGVEYLIEIMNSEIENLLAQNNFIGIAHQAKTVTIETRAIIQNLKN